MGATATAPMETSNGRQTSPSNPTQPAAVRVVDASQITNWFERVKQEISEWENQMQSYLSLSNAAALTAAGQQVEEYLELKVATGHHDSSLDVSRLSAVCPEQLAPVLSTLAALHYHEMSRMTVRVSAAMNDLQGYITAPAKAGG